MAINGSFNRDLVKDVFEHSFSIYDCGIAEGVEGDGVSGFQLRSRRQCRLSGTGSFTRSSKHARRRIGLRGLGSSNVFYALWLWMAPSAAHLTE